MIRAAGLCVVLALAGCVRESAELPEGTLVVAQETQASWVRNFNPLTTATVPRWPARAGVYEPLFVFNSVQSKLVPWLGLSHEWADDGRLLRIRLREGVRWSDGEAFDAEDVRFTFELLSRHTPLDRRGVWSFLEGVDVTGSHDLAFRFSRVYIPGFDEIGAQPIVPEHAWSQVEDPVTFANEEPVGTGPFTEVRVFRNQVYELGRNPYYWQEGRPLVDAIRCPALPSNDRANMALVFDEVDWAGNFVPAIDRVYVGRDPEHHAYWFPLTGSTIFLYANTQTPPYDDPGVRKALSQAIDRDLLVEVALYDYSRPADATGLSDAYEAWRAADLGADGDWVRHDAAAAEAALDAAGFRRGADGIRRLADGSRWTVDLVTVSGWSDWVRATQVIARSLQAVGIEASTKTLDFNAWFQRVQTGEFDLSLGWSFEGPTPYLFYRWLMSSDTVREQGVASMGNWHRFGSPAADAALRAFELASDPERQRALAAELQEIFVREAPAIPLYPNPSWAEFNTERFVGFPTAENPYADPSPNKYDRGECLLVLTTVAPR